MDVGIAADHRTRVVAWWARLAKRPTLLRLVVVVNLFIGLDGAAAVIWMDRPVSSVHIGALPTDDAAAQRRGPQPPPTAVDVPSIDIHSGVVALSIGADGALPAPNDFRTAGWWSGGPAPGANGGAVIVGHVDSHRGAAVFYRLRSLSPGASIVVGRADATQVTFIVDAIREYPKGNFPTHLIYRSTGAPSLRLITCGGRFDPLRGQYVDNVVVFAHLASSPEASVGHPRVGTA